MAKTLGDFLQRIPEYSDRELIAAAIYDAALFSPSELGFDILANRIFTELVKRDLLTNKANKARELVKRTFKETPKKRNMIISELRRTAVSGPIRWAAPTYDDIMGISKHLDDYEFTEDVDYITRVGNMPWVPEGYYWGRKDGALHQFMEDEDDLDLIYPGIITITRILLDRNNNSNTPQKAEVLFMCDEQEQLRKMNLKDLYNPEDVFKLANYGAYINKANAKHLAKYFFEIISNHRRDIPHIYITRQIGWQDAQYKDFVPYASEREYDCCEYEKEYQSVLQSQGNYKEWALLINPFRDCNHIPFRIILATSFASVLAEPLMHQPFFLNIHGRSQLGKTPSLMVVASPWANPDRQSGYIKDLAGSDEALELGAQFYGSLPYCLNESQNRVAQKKEPTIDKLVYLLGDGTPKTRGKGSGGLQIQSSWCNAIILTGEENLTGESDKLGVRMRAFDLHVSEKIISQDDKETESLCKNLLIQYNTAGPVFIRKLLNDGGLEEAIHLYDEFRAQIPANVETRQNHIAATILTADRLLAKWIFEDSNYLTVEDLLPYLKVRPDMPTEQDNESAQKIIDDWLRSELGDDFSKKSTYGRILKGTNIFVVFDDKTLVDMLSSHGYDVEKYSKWAKANGKLAANEKHGYKRGVNRIKNDPEHSGHLYALVLP